MRATREAFGEHLPIMGEHYDNIVALDADLGKATKIASFREAHPDRFFQIVLLEQKPMVCDPQQNIRQPL